MFVLSNTVWNKIHNLTHNICIVQVQNVFWCSLTYNLNVAKQLNVNFLFFHAVTVFGSESATSTEADSAISTVEVHTLSSAVPSTSTADHVIWCVASPDIYADAPSTSGDTLTIPTSAAVITSDDILSMSNRHISSTNTHGLVIDPSVSASGDTHGFAASCTSAVSCGPTQPTASGNSPSTTSYRFIFCTFFVSFYTVGFTAAGLS